MESVMKRQHTECKKIFANDLHDRGLISKIYKQCIQLNKKKETEPNQKNIAYSEWCQIRGL